MLKSKDYHPSFIQPLNEKITIHQEHLFLTRDSELQKESVKSLEEALKEVEILKEISIKNQNEFEANILLGYECVIESMISEFKMWIKLKNKEFDEAWSDLINSQKLNNAAINSCEGFLHLRERSLNLESIEKYVFPPQTFLSPGMIVKSQECSICGKEYEDCDHLKGKPYMGKFCTMIIKEVEINHLAIVKNPADKSRRIYVLGKEGEPQKNVMTGIISNNLENSNENKT